MRFSIDDRKLLWFAVLIGAIILRGPLIATLLPFLLAVALASVMEPAVNTLQNRARLPRPVAALITLIVVIVSGGYLFLMVSTKVLAELVQMGSLLQRYQRIPVDLASMAIERLNELNELFDQTGLPQAAQDNILDAVDNLTRAGIGFASQGINIVLNAVTQVPSLVIVMVIALIATYFLVKDREALTEAIYAAAPQPLRDRLKETQQRIIMNLVGFFKAQMLLMLLTAIIVAIGLGVIGINFWMTLALLAGILDFIPVLGPGFLFVPWAIGAAALGEGALAVQLILLMAVSFVLRQLLQAKLLGDSIGIHPLWMLMSLYAGIHFFGIYGVLVAPVILIIAKAVYHMSVVRSMDEKEGP